MSSFLIVDKKSLNEVTVPAETIVLNAAAIVHTGLYRDEVAQFIQDGNDLILYLKNGKKIVIVNYFVRYEDEESELLFEDDDNVVAWLPVAIGVAAGGAAIGIAAGSSGGSSDKKTNNAPIVSGEQAPLFGLRNEHVSCTGH